MRLLRIVAVFLVVALAAGTAGAQRQDAKRPPAERSAPVTDLAYGAFQKGLYVKAREVATRRAEEDKDPKAMTLLGELYAGGLGVRQDAKRAAQWYSLAAAHGDREATFALAMLHQEGRGVDRDRDEAARLFRAAAERGHPLAAHNLALLYLEGQVFPRDAAAAARWLRVAAEQDEPEAQYTLALLLKSGDGIKPDSAESARWLERAAALGHVMAMTESAIALFNGTGVERDEARATQRFREAALRGNPAAQNRYARILSAGRSPDAKPVEACAWHLLARAQNFSDPYLDQICNGLSANDREAAEQLLKNWRVGAIGLRP